ncbi:hypothetical protein D9613_008719 [Agrocybe pediades]|uniref:Uncharacterized protein n=1 Tax=Agrocybe pediades TaxID=84607 RepID=A0A8H4QTQ2_9AGAR|nr:hypothetical protein D9613_008719 [Agrocybe pediades]
MKFSTATFFVLFAAAASVLGQYDHDVDEMMAREFDFEEFEARGIEHELYVRQAEDITNVKRQLAQLERLVLFQSFMNAITSTHPISSLSR